MSLAELIKQPRSLEEADVDLTLKRLYDGGSLYLGELADRMAIAGIIDALRLAKNIGCWHGILIFSTYNGRLDI